MRLVDRLALLTALIFVTMIGAVALAQFERYEALMADYESTTQAARDIEQTYWEWERLATSGPTLVRPTAIEQVERLEGALDELNARRLHLSDAIDRLTFGRVTPIAKGKMP